MRLHLHANKIVLLGHSWGSILGVRMVQKHPEYFSAYVGTGQVANLRASLATSYRNVLTKAQRAHDVRTVQGLQRIGSPPYDLAHVSNVVALFAALAAYGPASDTSVVHGMIGTMLTAPNYTLRDISYRNLGFTTVPSHSLYEEMLSTDLTGITDFKVPVTIVEGSDDNVTIAPEAKRYFDRIRAPRKRFVVLQGAGHFAVMSMRGAFLPILKDAANAH